MIPSIDEIFQIVFFVPCALATSLNITNDVKASCEWNLDVSMHAFLILVFLSRLFTVSSLITEGLLLLLLWRSFISIKRCS